MNPQFNEKGQAVPEKVVPITGEAFEAKSGTEIYWLGNAGAFINSRGTTLMIDPVLSGFDMPLADASAPDVFGAGLLNSWCITSLVLPS